MTRIFLTWFDKKYKLSTNEISTIINDKRKKKIVTVDNLENLTYERIIY